MFGFVTIPVILSAGFVTDLVGKQPVVIGGCLLMAVSLIVLGKAGRYGSALAGIILLSASWAALVNVINPMAALTFGGSKAYSMNLACFCYGVGALSAPLAVGFLERRMGLTRALFSLAGLFMVPVLLAAAANFGTLAEAAEAAPGDAAAAVGIGTLLQDPIMWLCIAAILFYGPLEAATGAWTTTYLGEHGVSEGSATSLLSVFWLTYTASRLATALGEKVVGLPAGGERMMILILAIGAAGVLSGFVWGRGKGMAIAMVIGAGLVFGPIFPMIMAVLLGHFDVSVHGRAVGLMFAMGGIGTVTIPAAMGAYAKRTSVSRGFLIAVGAAIGLAATALILVLRG